MQTWQKIFNRNRRFYGWLVGILAAAACLPSVAPDAVPGVSAHMIALYSGCDTFTPQSHWLWRGLGNLFGLVPVGSLALRWNLVSAFFGIGVIVLVFLLTAGLAGNRRDQELVADNSRLAAGNFAGLVAALLLLTVLPFRVVAAVAHPMLFEWFLALLSFWLLTRFRRRKSLALAAAAVVMHGIAATQHPTVLYSSPLFVVLLLMILWKHWLLTPRPLVLLTAVAALSSLPFVLEAYFYLGTDTARWSGQERFGELLVSMLGSFYAALRHEIPDVGMVTVGLFSVAPFAMATLVPRKSQPGFFMMVVAGLVITFPMFFLFRFTPWPLFGFQPVMIAPYILAAMAAGVFSTYLLFIPSRSLFVMSRRSRATWLEPLLANSTACVIAVLIVASAVVSAKAMSVKAGVAAARFAADVVDQLEDGDWMVVEDDLEALLRLKAAEKDREIFFISATRIDSTAYRNALCQNLKNDRLCAMARVGLIPLLLEASQLPAESRPRIVVVGHRALLRWVTSEIIPDGLVYAVNQPQPDDLERFVEENLGQWQQTGEMLKKRIDPEGAMFGTLQKLLLNVSRTANDTGVWLEERERLNLAEACYEAAIQLAANNLSARLNLVELLPPEDPRVKGLKLEIEAISAAFRGRTGLDRIVATYGLLHHSAVSRYTAARWYRAGNTDIAMQELEADKSASRAQAALANPSDEEAFHELAAMVGLATGNNDRINVPETRAAILAMVRLGAMKDRPVLARQLLSLLEGRIDAAALNVEDANIDFLSGERDRAYEKLKALEETAPLGPRGWLLLALLTAESRPVEADRYLERLEGFPELAPQVRLALAQIYIVRGNVDAAAVHLEWLAQTRHLDRDVLGLYLELLLKEDRINSVMPTVRQMLSLDTQDPLANYALGQYLMAQGHLDEAHAALETSLAGKRTAEGLAALARLHHLNGNDDEALEAADASLAERPSAPGWLARALALEALGREEEASTAVREGLRIRPESDELQNLAVRLRSD